MNSSRPLINLKISRKKKHLSVLMLDLSSIKTPNLLLLREDNQVKTNL